MLDHRVWLFALRLWIANRAYAQNLRNLVSFQILLLTIHEACCFSPYTFKDCSYLNHCLVYCCLIYDIIDLRLFYTFFYPSVRLLSFSMVDAFVFVDSDCTILCSDWGVKKPLNLIYQISFSSFFLIGLPDVFMVLRKQGL